MKKIKLFDLMEKSFLALRKTNKKIWIIAILMSIFSGGLIIQESFYDGSYSDYSYEDEFLEDENFENEFTEDEVYDEEFIGDMSIIGDLLSDIGLEATFGAIISFVLIVIIIFIAIMIVMITFLNVIAYYLYHSIYEALYDTKLDRASLGLVVKVNLVVALKILGGSILFIVPGIIAGVKYAPANYILCKHPELSSKEVLSKTREFSKGFKWKIFLFGLFIGILSLIITSIISPSGLVEGYILIDLLGTLFTFVLTVFTVVYSGLFDVSLYKEIENFRDELSVE